MLLKVKKSRKLKSTINPEHKIKKAVEIINSFFFIVNIELMAKYVFHRIAMLKQLMQFCVINFNKHFNKQINPL